MGGEGGVGRQNDCLAQEHGHDLNKEEEDIEGKLSLYEGVDFLRKELGVGCNEDGNN